MQEEREKELATILKAFQKSYVPNSLSHCNKIIDVVAESMKKEIQGRVRMNPLKRSSDWSDIKNTLKSLISMFPSGDLITVKMGESEIIKLSASKFIVTIEYHTGENLHYVKYSHSCDNDLDSLLDKWMFTILTKDVYIAGIAFFAPEKELHR